MPVRQSKFASEPPLPMSKSCFRACLVALISVLFLSPTRSFADSYQLVGLGIDNTQFYGMTDSGAVVLYSYTSCGNPTTGCYETFNSAGAGNTDTAPADAWDDGTSCSPTLPQGTSEFAAVCNLGRVAFYGFETGNSGIEGLYLGTNSPELIASGEFAGPLHMNAVGDIVFDDGFNDEWVEAVDLTTFATPEPGSLALLATGILSLAVLRYRRRRPAQA